MKYYRQCRLSKHEGEKRLVTRSWIPEAAAIVGNSVKIKAKKSDPWEYWSVDTVGPRRDEESVNALSRQHKWTRPYSDI